MLILVLVVVVNHTHGHVHVYPCSICMLLGNCALFAESVLCFAFCFRIIMTRVPLISYAAVDLKAKMLYKCRNQQQRTFTYKLLHIALVYVLVHAYESMYVYLYVCTLCTCICIYLCMYVYKYKCLSPHKGDQINSLYLTKFDENKYQSHGTSLADVT